MTGSPKNRSPVKKRLPEVEQILSGSVRSASYNIVFQVLTRIFTFALNAFILRYVSHDVLGICNVRLALLYSSVMFLSREPFRRACLRMKETENWAQAVNLIWLVVPNTIFWSFLFGYIWCYYLSLPDAPNSSVTDHYRWSVWVIALSCVIDSLSEVPYIVGQYFLFYKLRIVGDTTLIAIRSLFLCFAVLFVPTSAISAYAFGSLFAAFFVGVIYYGYFHYYFTVVAKRDLPFTSVTEFAPNLMQGVSGASELGKLVWSFYKQGVLKQILTEGERYMMTFFDILTFDEQGVYDLVSNLGSLAARFIFLPIEESAYFYFAKTLERRVFFTKRDKNLAQQTAEVLGSLVRLMLMIGFIMLVYGIHYSNTVLYLYGGENLSEKGSGTQLLQANCAYIFVMALNGVTEAFTFAAMTQGQMDNFNRKLVGFSAIFLLASYAFTKMFGSVGFFVANSLNMGLRVAHSIYMTKLYFASSSVDPFESWKPKELIALAFSTAFILINISYYTLFGSSRLLQVVFGVIIFAINCGAIVFYDKELIHFFVKMYKVKKS